MIIPLSVKNQSVDSSGITKDYKEAICEYIWNGFEAQATEINVSFTLNDLGGIASISVSDNGTGIDYNDIFDTFGAFLASQKNNLSLKIKSKQNKGKGRFSFTAFSTQAKWNTVFDDNGTLKQYDITLDDATKESIDCSDCVDSNAHQTGTTVTFYNVFQLLEENLLSESFERHLLSEFSWYLYLNRNKGVRLVVNNEEIDFNKYINTTLSETITRSIDDYKFEISIIVWNEKIKEKYRCYFFDSKESIKGIDTTTYNRNTLNFSHSVFVSSEFFNTWDYVPLFDVSDQITFDDGEESVRMIVRKLRKEIQSLIESKIAFYMSSKADSEIQKMIEDRKTFPKFSEDEYGELRRRDMIRVTKEIYCLEPRIFYKLKDVQEKSLLAFLNLLLSSEERENILTVIEQIVELDSIQRQKFAEILKKTSLENIIDTISFVENRYRVIELLKHIIYDLHKYANERDNIQKIIESNYWIFGEQYHLASADQNMYRALEQYNYILYGAKAPTDTLSEEMEAQRRMDIFMCSSRALETSYGSYVEENIVVELKAPQITLNKTVLRQVEDYMDFIRKNPQFNSVLRNWKFIAVCKTVDDDVRHMYTAFKDKGKPGLVFQSDMYEVYALTWDDVFKSFELRHKFILDKLNYNREALVNELSKQYPGSSRAVANNLTNIAVANL